MKTLSQFLSHQLRAESPQSLDDADLVEVRQVLPQHVLLRLNDEDVGFRERLVRSHNVERIDAFERGRLKPAIADEQRPVGFRPDWRELPFAKASPELAKLILASLFGPNIWAAFEPRHRFSSSFHGFLQDRSRSVEAIRAPKNGKRWLEGELM